MTPQVGDVARPTIDRTPSVIFDERDEVCVPRLGRFSRRLHRFSPILHASLDCLEAGWLGSEDHRRP